MDDGNTYDIEFDTSTVEHEHYIRTIRVTLCGGALLPGQEAQIDLADHPYYLALQRYVLANPR